jgi:hypothetical protein
LVCRLKVKNRKQQRHERARQCGGEKGEPQAAGRQAHGEAADRADQHHALDAEIQDPGALGDEFAERRVHERRRRGHRADDDRTRCPRSPARPAQAKMDEQLGREQKNSSAP